MNALEAMARAELDRCAEVLREAGLLIVPPSAVTIRCDIRGKVRGWALLRQRVIRLNPAYYEQVGERYRQTVAHEYAHLIVDLLETATKCRQERSHGPRWQRVMRLLGYDTARSSAYGCVVPKARRTRKYFYRCVNDSAHVFRATSGQHKRLQAGSPGYCPKCLPLRPRHECGVAFDREEFA